MKFPRIKATSLEDKEFTLPRDFEGELNLTLIAFQRWQQEQVDSWLPLARQLRAAQPDFRYYELPTIYRGNPVFRWWLDTVMKTGIPDANARAITITLYLDKSVFREALGITREDTIQALLVNREGEVIWRGEGAFTPELGQALTEAITGRLKV